MKSFYDMFRPVPSINELDMNVWRPNDIAMKRILGNSRNLEILIVPLLENPSEMLPFMAMHNPKLKRMQIIKIEADCGPVVEFKFLTCLKVVAVDNFAFPFLANFLANNPSIELLEVSHFRDENVKTEDWEKVLEMPNLKLLRFFMNELDMHKICDGIIDGYKIVEAKSREEPSFSTIDDGSD